MIGPYRFQNTLGELIGSCLRSMDQVVTLAVRKSTRVLR